MRTEKAAMIEHSRPWLSEEDERAVVRVLQSGMIAQGRTVLQLEQECCRFAGGGDGVAVASGTAALTLALTALGLRNGAEVVLPTYTCRAVADAVLTAGLTPVLCDIGPDWVMTPETVSRVTGPRTGAILAVHMFGIAADVPALQALGFPVVEDACQAFGIRCSNGGVAGLVGDVGVFSFHATKCLTGGEGGLAVSRNPDIIRRMKARRDGDATGRLAAPMSDLQAALVLSQLGRYDRMLQIRREIAEYYLDSLEGVNAHLPGRLKGRSMFFRFPVQTAAAFASVESAFAAAGIRVRRGVDHLLHWEAPGVSAEKFRQAEKLYAETVCLPIYPALSVADRQRVAAMGRDIFGRQAV